MVEASENAGEAFTDYQTNPDAVPEGDGAISDPQIFNQQHELMGDEIENEFTVRDPINSGGHIVYKVTGKDKEGTFEIERRYNEFFILHETLSKRWPCIPIPMIPPKKNFGNKDIIFIQQRRYYLERFLRKLAHFDYIIDSEEFKLFSRPQGMNVEKSLERLPKFSISQLYDRIKQATQVNEAEFDL